MKPSVPLPKLSFVSLIVMVFFLVLMGSACTQKSEAPKTGKPSSEEKTSVAAKPSTETKAPANEFKILSATDQENQLKVQIKVPADWMTRKDLNDDAVIQSSDKASTLFLVVISEPKNQFDKDAQLKDYADIVIENFLEKTEGQAKITKEAVKTTVNGRPALQYEIERKMNKITSVTLIYTMVEGPKGFHQIMAWTYNSYWGEQQPLLKSITDSFREETGFST
ncbi:MAG: hypothetical protein FWF41_09855 [Betaproteobacteria bacterium]|nr:hypothetical protein [Betaproteobacteria bacterium]